MFHVCIAHCMPEKIHKMSKCENSCLFMWNTVCLYVQTTTMGCMKILETFSCIHDISQVLYGQVLISVMYTLFRQQRGPSYIVFGHV